MGWSQINAQNDEIDAARRIVTARREQAKWHFDSKVADHCENGELIYAALAHIYIPGDDLWPWAPQDFKPWPEAADNMIEAGMYLAAEADRLRRAHLAGKPVASGLVRLPDFEPEDLARCVDGLRKMDREIDGIRDCYSGS